MRTEWGNRKRCHFHCSEAWLLSGSIPVCQPPGVPCTISCLTGVSIPDTSGVKQWDWKDFKKGWAWEKSLFIMTRSRTIPSGHQASRVHLFPKLILFYSDALLKNKPKLQKGSAPFCTRSPFPKSLVCVQTFSFRFNLDTFLTVPFLFRSFKTRSLWSKTFSMESRASLIWSITSLHLCMFPWKETLVINRRMSGLSNPFPFSYLCPF